MRVQLDDTSAYIILFLADIIFIKIFDSNNFLSPNLIPKLSQNGSHICG